jgi:RimJ/RimL family protein N-acetyltransferase
MSESPTQIERPIVLSPQASPKLVQLKPLDSPALIQLAAGWLAQKENYQWLDFGDGRQMLTPEWLKIMSQRATHVLRVYTSDDEAIGIVGLDDVNREFKTARIWAVAGTSGFREHGYATLAVSKMLSLGFRDLGLRAVSTWIVEPNHSVRIVQRLGFTFIGRQRQCHYIDGRAHDRLWFDLLASEHEEI